MRILHVTSDWKWTGPAEPMLVLLEALRARGHDVELVCPAAPADGDAGILEEARARGVETALELARGRGIRPLGDTRDARRLRARILRHHRGARAREGDGDARRSADVVHVWHTRAHGLALRALGVGRSRRSAIVRAHSDSRPLGAKGFEGWLFGPGTDGLVCTSAACAGSHEPLRTGRCTAGWLGAVDLGRFTPEAAAGEGRAAAARAALGVPPGAPLVGVVARAQPRRRFDLIFEAWERVVAARPAARLLILGRGTHFDRVVREPAQRAALGNSVVLAGHRRGSDYVDLVRALDVLCFLVPGSDAGCRAVLEAAACAVPAIVSRRGALPEIVLDGRTGLISDEEPAALARAFEALLSDEGRRRAMGDAAARRARTHFDPSRLAAECEAFYERVVASLAGRGAQAGSSLWSATSSR